MAGDINNIEIFATGTWIGNRRVTVTSKTLDDMVNSFYELTSKVDGFRPFIKLGHKEMQGFGGESGAPSFGFISKIWREGNKVLANFSNVPDALVDLINAGRYNAVSIEFLPTVNFGGETFKSVLRAVALLGAELPAVKTLKGLSASLMSEDAYVFEDADPIETLEKEAPVANEATYNQSQVDALVEAAVSKAIDEKTAELADSTNDLSKVVAERDEQIVALTEARDKAETSLKDYVKAADAAEVVALVDGAINEGKVLPAERNKYIALANVDATVKLGEDEMSPRQILESIFKDLPKKVNLSEESDGDDPTKDVGDEGTAGEIVDAKARALMGAKDGLSYSDAYTQVLREDPDLKERYFKQEA
jgi:hypothetical protein